MLKDFPILEIGMAGMALLAAFFVYALVIAPKKEAAKRID